MLCQQLILLTNCGVGCDSFQASYGATGCGNSVLNTNS